MNSKHRRDKKPSILRETAVVLASALALSVVVRTFLFQAFWVPSESMYNTLQDNDRILVSKFSVRATGIHRGDVIVFHDPNNWLGRAYENPYDTTVGRALQFIGVLPANSGRDLVKRVIGVGNDVVECCDTRGNIKVNGKSQDEPYIKDHVSSDQYGSFKVQVPEGSLFVMGDNRGNSADSRAHLSKNNGLVPLKNVVGRVVVRIWPFGRIGGIER